jgi:predicted amidohydrolase
MKIAAVQMVSTPDVDRNLAAAARLIGQAASQGAALVSLPEYFCFMGRDDRDKLAIAEAPGDGPIQRFLAAQAREHRVWLIGGTLPIRTGVQAADTGRAMNRNTVWSPEGTLAAHYDKLHLFRYRNEAGEDYDEGRTLQAGERPVALDIGGWRTGLSICYDLRFPELYRALSVPPCDLLSVPAAFTWTTGRAHWETLLRARAIENQCYVFAAAQGGRHENGRRTWGHSLVIDPWGEVLSMVEAEGEGVALAEMRRERIDEVRRQLPALSHRRAF